MKSRTSILFVVICMLVVFGVYHEFGGAEGTKKEVLPARTAVVSVQRILLEGEKNKSWEVIIQGEADKMKGELMQLRGEITSGEERLKTRSPESSDYEKFSRELMEKAATLKAKEDFFQQDIMYRQQRWAEKSFREVLAIVETVAKDKGLDVVLAKEEHQWPVNSANELMLVMRTSKVLYSAESLDITEDVLSAWNAAK